MRPPEFPLIKKTFRFTTKSDDMGLFCIKFGKWPPPCPHPKCTVQNLMTGDTLLPETRWMTSEVQEHFKGVCNRLQKHFSHRCLFQDGLVGCVATLTWTVIIIIIIIYWRGLAQSTAQGHLRAFSSSNLTQVDLDGFVSFFSNRKINTLKQKSDWKMKKKTPDR